MEDQLRFGTAGVRAPVGPGPHQMNVTTVTRITAGFAAWLAERAAQLHIHHTAPTDSAAGIGRTLFGVEGPLRVAVGYDTRYGSSIFAQAVAEVLAGAGFEVSLLPTPTPTPFIPWMITDRHLDAGVQITASQNPAADNGYKIYLEDGTPLRPSYEAEVLAAIAAVGEVTDIPRVTVHPVADQLRRYVDTVASFIAPAEADKLRVNNERAALKVVYTPLHGVGGRALTHALEMSGFALTYPVREQLYPDPTFPTVSFPTPEEPGATALALEMAGRVGADVVIVLDPDADRCGVGVRQADGSHRMLSGDELGALLASRLVGSGEPVVATSIVSSRLLQRMAQERGWDYVETETGFKNLLRAADDRPGELVFAYEEALGYAPFPAAIPDKDGIATALVTCAWAAELKGVGTSLLDQVHQLTHRYGAFAGTHIGVRTLDPAALIAQIRSSTPNSLAGVMITATDLPSGGGVILSGSGALGTVRVAARASGTELKAKLYLEVSDTPSQEAADALLTELVNDVNALLAGL
ncbi:MAG: phospho-sugar mutase [Corynebacterium sp.]|nr:phospho-sugar mutase [Corynebacterium sp.]